MHARTLARTLASFLGAGAHRLRMCVGGLQTEGLILIIDVPGKCCGDHNKATKSFVVGTGEWEGEREGAKVVSCTWIIVVWSRPSVGGKACVCTCPVELKKQPGTLKLCGCQQELVGSRPASWAVDRKASLQDGTVGNPRGSEPNRNEQRVEGVRRSIPPETQNGRKITATITDAPPDSSLSTTITTETPLKSRSGIISLRTKP